MVGMTSFPIQPNYANQILVANPSNVVRQRVLESLRSPVRSFEQAAGGAETLVHLESGFWQVLFLDRRLPDLDAEELSETVRRRFPGIEVVMLDPRAPRTPPRAKRKKAGLRKCGPRHPREKTRTRASMRTGLCSGFTPFSRLRCPE